MTLAYADISETLAQNEILQEAIYVHLVQVSGQILVADDTMGGL